MRYFVPFLFLAFSPVLADENPFLGVRDRYQWAIEQVMAHKPLMQTTDSGEDQEANNKLGKGKPKKQPDSLPVFKTQIYKFQTETDKAKVEVELTDLGNSFIADVTSDQLIEGWLLKKQSTKDAFLKGTGATDNPYKCRIRVDRPYIKDFGLTVYVTKDSDPAFIQLF